MTRLSIDISNEMHRYLKIHTAYTKETIVDFVRSAIEQKLKSEKLPNKQTLMAIDSLENGAGEVCDNIKSLMQSLNDED